MFGQRIRIVTPGGNSDTATGQRNHTGAFMRQVIYATIPGVLVLTWLFGWGTLFNLMVAIPAALIAEAAVLKARGRDIRFALSDWSAVVTAVLLAIGYGGLRLMLGAALAAPAVAGPPTR